MIQNVFSLLKNTLNAYYKSLGITEEMLGFSELPAGDGTIKFKKNTITPVLINIEEERIMRPADLYAGRIWNSSVKSEHFPEIRINLQVLFVSKFNNYIEGLKMLSYVITFFQINRVFDHHNAPTLNSEIEKLIIELSTPMLKEQDAIWNALRTSYLPSVLYKIKMLTYIDKESFQAAHKVLSVPLSLSSTEEASQT